MKSVYQDLLVEASITIGRTRSRASIESKYIKLKFRTEDKNIHTMIDSLIEHVGEARRLYAKKMYAASSKEYEVIHNIQRQIVEYCNSIISSGKPEWMILAERNGWTPPKTEV